MYKPVSSADGALLYVIDTEKRVSIPPDPANTDYQAYLAWFEEGNEPLPADDPSYTPDAKGNS